MNDVIKITNWQNRGYLVESASGGTPGLVIHGYGGSAAAMLGLAVSLAVRLPLRLLAFDLPGHAGASDTMLTAAAVRATLKEAAAALGEPAFFIGHSLGARVGLDAGLPRAALISPPGEAEFEGSRGELLKLLKPRRVRESAPFAGLQELLAQPPEPASDTLLLSAAREPESVRSLAREWQDAGISCHRVAGTDHNDIIHAPETGEVIASWLKERRV